MYRHELGYFTYTRTPISLNHSLMRLNRLQNTNDINSLPSGSETLGTIDARLIETSRMRKPTVGTTCWQMLDLLRLLER
jgi:hypothetical protein